MLRVTSPFAVLFMLSLSLGLNVLAVYRLRIQRAEPVTHVSADDTRYSYIGDDHPARLPVDLPYIALEIEDTKRFGISDPMAWPDWRNTDLFPQSNGFVRLGEQGRMFGISMFHQMHCLQMLRKAIIEKDSANTHTQHCLNLLRQAVLCASDTTLDPMNVSDEGKLIGTDGVGIVHVCRDWEKVYEFVRTNQMGDHWNRTST